MKVMGYVSGTSKGKVWLQDSFGDEPICSTNPEKLLFYLCEPYEDYEEQQGRPPVVVRLAWDLDQFVAPLLQLLGAQHCRELAETHKTQWKDYRLYYIPEKVFSVKYGSEYNKYFSRFYDLRQYYQDTIDPPVDAFEVEYLGKKQKEVMKRMGIETEHWTSPAKVLKETVLKDIHFPTIKHNEERLKKEFVEDSVKYAFNCCGRSWIANFKVGHWESGEIHDYDITSAYPSETIKLMDTRPSNCWYTKSDKYDWRADWGFLYGDITINKDFSPIMCRDAKLNLQNPVGKWRDYITLDEVNFIETHKIGTFKLIDGWFLHFKDHTPIFKDVLERLFSYRTNHFLTNALAKRMMNCLYGITVERDDDGRVREFYNPFFGAMITARTRLKVAEFIIKNGLQENLVSINTDGCLVDKKVSENKLGTGIGKWKYAGDDATFVLSSGWVLRADKKPHGITYPILREMIAKHPNRDCYSVELSRRYTMAEALDRERTFGLAGFNLMGTIGKFGSTVDLEDIRYNQHRVFDKFPTTGKELLNNKYTSKPIRI